MVQYLLQIVTVHISPMSLFLLSFPPTTSIANPPPFPPPTPSRLPLQAFSQIRTVYSFVREERTESNFSGALMTSMPASVQVGG